MTSRNTINDRMPLLGGSSRFTGREPELSGLRARAAPLVVHVDDDLDLLTLVRHVLTMMGGYRVESFKSGEEAYEYCLTYRPDALVTDLIRPGMDGVALCRKIRTHPHLQDLPVVVFSAVRISADELRDEFGVRFLSKPCRWQDILTSVDSAIMDAAQQGDTA